MTINDRITVITSGPVAGAYAAGFGLIALGLAVGSAWQQVQVFTGGVPRHGLVVTRAVIAVAALAVYGPLCNGVWNMSQALAASIYSEADRATNGTAAKVLLVQAYAALFKDGLLFAPISGIRNTMLMAFMAATAWFTAFALEALQIAQVCVFNVVFAFGPISLGLYVFGFRTGELWLTALLEISSWSVTSAIVRSTLTTRIAQVAVMNAGEGALQFDWWDSMKEISFIGSLIVFVPVITSRFLGFSALGELSRVTLGQSAAMSVAGALQSFGAWRSAPTVNAPSSTDNRRAGD